MLLLRRSILLLIVAFFDLAQAQTKTDAQMDGFSGPIKSVVSATERTGVKWSQPGGPMLIPFLWCKVCKYDPDGAKTKSGDLMSGGFLGETRRLVRDGDGHVVERFSYSSSDSKLQHHEVMGPFGKIEQ